MTPKITDAGRDVLQFRRRYIV